MSVCKSCNSKNILIERGINLIKVLDSSLNILAILNNVIDTIISEAINREFTFSFTAVIDNDKSSYVNYQNKVEVEDNYFNIVYTEEERTTDGLFINAQCEHVSYDWLDVTYTAGFTATGVFSAVVTSVISAVNTALTANFTFGTCDITASQTISINEEVNARSVLMQLAALYGGELKFDKYEISLLTRRGADRGVQFRYRKNLVNVSRMVDNRTKTDAGLPTTSYKANAAELEFEQNFISDGVSNLEHYELGDTVKVIDEDLNLEVSLRIVKESHNTEQRMQGTVEIGNFVDDLTDTLTQIQTTTVVKDAIYNSCSIGPENGFVTERNDGITKTYSNATDGFTMQLRDSATASYTSVFYVQYDTATGTANLYLVGNAVFTGTVEASIINGSDIIGGTITIGTGSNTFNANGVDGIWLGYSAFVTAPFNVTLSGALTAQNAQITGDILAGSTFTVATGSNTIRADSSGLYVGSSAFSTAPFRVSLSGSVTATDVTMTGNSTITGGIITGGTIRTAASGSRIELSGNVLTTYNSSGQKNGPYIYPDDGDIIFHDNDTPILSIGLPGTSTVSIQPLSGYTLLVYDPQFSGTVIGAGVQLSYDTATNTLSLEDDSGVISSVVIP